MEYPEYGPQGWRAWSYLISGFIYAAVFISLVCSAPTAWEFYIFAAIPIYVLTQAYRAFSARALMRKWGSRLAQLRSDVIQCEIWLEQIPIKTGIKVRCLVQPKIPRFSKPVRPLATTEQLATGYGLPGALIFPNESWFPGRQTITQKASLEMRAYYRPNDDRPFLLEKDDVRVWLAS